MLLTDPIQFAVAIKWLYFIVNIELRNYSVYSSIAAIRYLVSIGHLYIDSSGGI